MRERWFVFLVFLPFLCFPQFREDFSDGNFTENPSWVGMSENFIVNADFQLQSFASKASQSFLFTPSESFDDAEWQCWVKINYPNTASNYARIYLTSDRVDSISNCDAYYLQVGGRNKNISLYYQQRGAKSAQILVAGEKDRLDFDSVAVNIKVTRSAEGKFSIYSQLSDESSFLLEGERVHRKIQQANYFGLMFSNTNKTGRAYFFDDIRVSGHKAIDATPPELEFWEIVSDSSLVLTFSEPMNFSKVSFDVENFAGTVLKKDPSSDLRSVLLLFSSGFEKGVLYTIRAENLTDRAGNEFSEEAKLEFAFTDLLQQGDVVINEILFDVEQGENEYIEIFNKSDKILDASEIFFATRKADLSLSALVSIAEKTIFPPGSCLAICENPEALKLRYNCPAESRIYQVSSWNNLNNEEATVLLTDKTKQLLFDELSYTKKWHHPLIVWAKGVSLERISPFLPTQDANSWHSAASTVGYGTPGYRNSQYREPGSSVSDKKMLWVEPEVFSPDNDGENDLCVIHYLSDEPGYLANITIFNAGGVKVIQLAENSLLESEGSFIWDGKNESGQLLNVGIYLLYFEMFHPQKGKKKQFKLPIVLSTK